MVITTVGEVINLENKIPQTFIIFDNVDNIEFQMAWMYRYQLVINYNFDFSSKKAQSKGRWRPTIHIYG